MDECFSPLSMVLFLVFIGLEAAFYGLGSAIQNVSEADLEKDAEEGNKQAKWLLKVMEQPKYFVYSLQAVTNVIGLILGSYVLRSWGSCLGLWIVKTTGWDVKLGGVLGLILAAIVILVVLISFGIVIPKRCGAKKAAVLVLPAGSSGFSGDGSGISIYYGGDRAFTGDSLGFACRYYQ